MTLFSSIEKPTLLIDEAAARSNIRRMAAKARAGGVRFRPHFKTHQSAEVGEWFRDEGVRAITVSSVDMAEYFASHGWYDITIAFPANLRQAKAIAGLARSIHLGLLVENEEAVLSLASVLDAPADVWLKIDAGLGRTGLAWGHPDAVYHLAQVVRQQPLLRLKGLLTHAGFTYEARGKEQVCHAYAQSIAKLVSLQSALSEAGLESLMLSVGDTPGSSLCDDLGPVDEIRPGNFVYYDAMQLSIGSCEVRDVAAALACPVVALHPERGEAVLYGGAVHLSKDFYVENSERVYGLVTLPGERGWGAPLQGAYVARLSQEHGVIKLQPDDLGKLKVGDLVCILPAHSCLTVTLMRRCLTLDGRWIDTLNA